MSFNKPHGGYLAILRKKGNVWFFLYSREKDKTPSWNIDELKSLSKIEFNTETARNYATYKKFDRVNERIFKKTGWYRVMVSHEDFGQDDPPWTGMCEIYYVNKKRPPEK